MGKITTVRALFVVGMEENLEVVSTMINKTIAAFVSMNPELVDAIVLESRSYCFRLPCSLQVEQIELEKAALNLGKKASDDTKEQVIDVEQWENEQYQKMWVEIWDAVCTMATFDVSAGEDRPVDVVIAVDKQASLLIARIDQTSREKLKVPYVGIGAATRFAQQEVQDKIWLFQANGAPIDMETWGVLPRWFNVLQDPALCGELCEDLTDIYCIILPKIFSSLDSELQNQVQQAYDLWRRQNDDCNQAYYQATRLLMQALGEKEYTKRHNAEFTRCFIDLALGHNAKHIMIEPCLHGYLQRAVFDEIRPNLRLLDPGVYLAKYLLSEVLKLKTE